MRSLGFDPKKVVEYGFAKGWLRVAVAPMNDEDLTRYKARERCREAMYKARKRQRDAGYRAQRRGDL
jgi:hypothetical protein